jgi:thiosulfate dehydrogenase
LLFRWGWEEIIVTYETVVSMGKIRPYLFPLCLAVVFFISFLLGSSPSSLLTHTMTRNTTYNENTQWQPPDERTIPFDEEGERIRYGKELIIRTALYLGPKGIVASKSNGMNCQNCHLQGGTQNFSNPFSAVASTYPKYRERSGRVESIEFRVNDCMQRSLNGQPLDSTSHEMRAMVAYIKWVGKDVPQTVTPKGAAVEELPLLNRAADTVQGRVIFMDKCQRCHGPDGQGVSMADGKEFQYPPLWGDRSFNMSAGLFRLTRLAGFIKNSMPFGVTSNAPELTAEQAWDVAAYIVARPRPQKQFANDWKNLSKKPFDYPFGPYADTFSTTQHRFGPFGPIKKGR